MSVVPADGHLLDWQDEKLVTEYMYAMLEQRLGKDRRVMDLVINCWASLSNQLYITLVLPRGGEAYRDYHPLYDY